MKKILTILGGIVMVGATAQSYDFNQTTNTYTPLSNAVALTDELWDDQEYDVDLGFTFELFDQEVSNIHLDVNGQLSVSTGTQDYSFGLFATDIVDGGFNTPDFTSIPVQYTIEGSAGDQIFKVQWEDAAIWGATEASLDFQIWMYESSGNVEIHFGENNIDSLPIGVGIVIEGGGIAFSDGFLLTGEANSPQTTTFIGQKLDGAPDNGTTFQFIRTAAAAVNELTEEALKIKITSEGINYQTNESLTMQVFDLEGRLIHHEKINQYGTLRNEQFACSVLIVRFQSEDGRLKVLRYFAAR